MQAKTQPQSDIFCGRLDFLNAESVKKTPKPEPDSNTEFIKETAGARNDSFNRRLRKDPLNIDLWIEFIGFQDHLPSSSSRSLLERKTSIIERALDYNPSSLVLIKMHLKLASEYMPFTEILKSWDKHLQLLEERNDESVWPLVFDYLNFRMNHFSCFNVEQILSAFAEFFKKESSWKTKVDLLALLLTFLHRTGHYEKMVALLQMIIEVNVEIFNYKDIDLDAYADQWDSGLMPHVGESILTHSATSLPRTLFGSWIVLETIRERNQFYPLADDDVDDLDRSVLFYDVSDFLFCFPADKILEAIKILLGHFCEITGATCVINFLEKYREPLDDCIFDLFLKGTYCVLLPYYKNDWEVICSWMLMNRDDVKQALSDNRQSIPHFLAYGLFCILTNDVFQARRVLQTTMAKQSPYKNEMLKILDLEGKQAQIFEERWYNDITGLAFESKVDNDKKRSVYELLQKYPGDKKLYMELISLLADKDEALCMEIYNLMNEQQVRLRCLIEEVEFMCKK